MKDVLLIVLVTIVTIGLMAWSLPEEAEAISYFTYTVQAGETLWQIASKFYPERVTGEMVMLIRSINTPDGQELLDPGRIQPGQELLLPVY